jgi:GNAT superfamily N-acetyltransferase
MLRQLTLLYTFQTMKCNCRHYQNSDLVTLQSLILELGYNVGTHDLEKNIHEINLRGGAIFVAEVNEEIVGSICMIIDARLAEGVYAEIVSLVVTKNYRGKGIGKQLVNQAELWARKYVNKLRVRANVTRNDAHKFYKSLGFKESKEQKVLLKLV